MRNNKNKIENKLNKTIQQKEEIEYILQLTEGVVDKKSSKAHIDKENEIIKLIGGRTTSQGEIKQYLSQWLREYEKIFPQKFYKNMLRLCGYPVPKGKVRYKPSIFAVYTNEIIYKRFPKHVLETVQVLNPFVIPGCRLNYHHQWLNEEGRAMVREFIEDAIDMMENHKDWYAFRIEYALEYRLDYQLRINFDDTISERHKS